MYSILDESIKEIIDCKAKTLEEKLESDVVCYLGTIEPAYVRFFRDFIEEVKTKSGKERLSIVLRTPGGSVEATERFVDIVRHHYKEVWFIVPDFAMSAGTIWCMSGNQIFMDYSSSLGPIDPQVVASDESCLVPALGYLDKVNEIISKDKLSEAEIVLLKGLDLAKLGAFEQAKELSIDLLKKWLVEYKFSTWVKHRKTNPGKPVTYQEKVERAEEIARILADNTYWHSHGRNIDVHRLQALKLEIANYSEDAELRSAIRNYHDSITMYAERMRTPIVLHHHKIEG